jgi:WD40 repeat protein
MENFKKLQKTEINDKEILEMILQFFYENKFVGSAKQLEQSANIVYDQNEIQQLFLYIKSRQYDDAIKFLIDGNFDVNRKQEVMKIIKTRKFLEFVKMGKTLEALEFLRKELAVLIKDRVILNKMSILLFQKDQGNLEKLLKQFFNEINIDEFLVKKIQTMLCLSLDSNGNRILPNSRLETLLNTYYNEAMDVEDENLALSHQDKLSTLSKCFIIEKYEEEIWHIEVSSVKRYIATCARNGMVCIFVTEFVGKTVYMNCKSSFLAHKKYVTAMDWSSDETCLLTASADKLIKLWNPFEGKCIKTFAVHTDIVTSLKWLSGDTFISGSIDKKLLICTTDNRVIGSENFFRIRKVLVSKALSCVIIIPSSMNDIVFYDYNNYKELNRLTELDPVISANISQSDNGKFLIVNSSKVNAYINLYDLTTYQLVGKYYGHTQEQYVIECCFGGINDEYIICGSEDCLIYIWERSNSIPVHVVKGHTGCINSCRLIYNDSTPYMVSVSDDFTIRLWHDSSTEVVYEDSTVRRNDRNNFSDLYRDSVYSGSLGAGQLAEYYNYISEDSNSESNDNGESDNSN